MSARRTKAFLCVWCEERRRGAVFSCTADLERHTSVVHAHKVTHGESSVEVRYRPVLIQGR